MDNQPMKPRAALEHSTELAGKNQLWEAAAFLMSTFEQLGDLADAPETDSLGRPIRGSTPPLMEKAADWLDLLDNLEADGQESPEGTPPRHLRWAMWHTLNGQAEIRRQHPGRAVDHLELAAGLFESDHMVMQAVPLLAQVADCQLAVGDVRRAEDSLVRARRLADDETRARYGAELARISGDIAARL